MKKIKFAIVGCGRIAARHAEHISNFGELHAVCDIKPELAKKFGEKYSCKHYTNFNEMLINEKDSRYYFCLYS